METRTVADQPVVVVAGSIEAEALATLKALATQGEKEEKTDLVPEVVPIVAPTTTFGTVSLVEKEDSFSEEESIGAQFGRLYKHLEAAKKRKTNIWGLVDLIKGFTTACGYELDDDENEILFDDMKAAADMLDAANAFIKAKKDEQGNVPSSIQSKFEAKLDAVLTCAKEDMTNTNSRERVRSILIKIGIALSIVALGAAAGVLAAGAAPLIAAGCLVAGIIFLAASAIAHYRQSNCTFFGQAQKNHMLMADLVATESSVLEPETAGCFRN